jgi:hypothetical protein
MLGQPMEDNFEPTIAALLLLPLHLIVEPWQGYLDLVVTVTC